MSDRPLTLLLIDDDQVFRTGMRVWLGRFADVDVVGEIDSGAAALELLATIQTSPASPASPLADALNLVILGLELGRSPSNPIQGFALCQEIKTRYPALPVLVLSSQTDPVIWAAAQQVGADGFCPKKAEVNTLKQVIDRVAAKQFVWQRSPGAAPTLNTASEGTAIPPGLLAILRQRLRQSSLNQIAASLTDISNQLHQPDLSHLDRAVLAGRYRELRAARWLVQRLLATPKLAAAPSPLQPTSSSEPVPSTNIPASRSATDLLVVPSLTVDQLAQTHSLQGILFDAISAKLQTNLFNQTDTPLEIDILRDDRKRELLYLVARKVEQMLDELRFSQVQPDQLPEKRSPLLLDLWQAVTTDFFGKYYTVSIQGTDQEVVPILLQEASIVQTAILNTIPFVPELLAHLLFQTPLVVDSVPYAAGNPEALARAEALLDHLLIQVANGVIQPLLNRFATIETIKHSFYDRRLLSIRDLEQFRNNLSWKYRLELYVGVPKDIFESHYRLWVIQGRGIQRIAIYAPRSQELEQLTGLPYVVTLALEARDAIAPRLRSAIAIVGTSLVYVLTEVIGRGIGLIGRGIFKGVGNVWQENRK